MRSPLRVLLTSTLWSAPALVKTRPPSFDTASARPSEVIVFRTSPDRRSTSETV